ncbi:MAG: hypothetical protein OXH04_09725, partial [Acidobacteria bacterium]|nr:hypothetical protein [Acidobacteriota bacterium]
MTMPTRSQRGVHRELFKLLAVLMFVAGGLAVLAGAQEGEAASRLGSSIPRPRICSSTITL